MLHSPRQSTNLSLLTCLNSQYSFIRIFNSLIKSEALDIYINNEFLIAQNLKALQIGPYIPGCKGKFSIQIYLANTKDNPLLNANDIEVTGGQIITLAITGDLNNLKLTSIIDDIEQKPKPKKSIVRFYNSTSSSLIFLMSSNDSKSDEFKLARQAENNNGSEYVEIPIGTYRLGVRPSNGIGQILSIDVTLNADTIYTLYCIGTPNPESKKLGLDSNLQMIQAIDGNTIIKKCTF